MLMPKRHSIHNDNLEDTQAVMEDKSIILTSEALENPSEDIVKGFEEEMDGNKNYWLSDDNNSRKDRITSYEKDASLFNMTMKDNRRHVAIEENELKNAQNRKFSQSENGENVELMRADVLKRYFSEGANANGSKEEPSGESVENFQTAMMDKTNHDDYTVSTELYRKFS